MKSRIITVLICIFTFVCGALGLTACNGGGDDNENNGGNNGGTGDLVKPEPPQEDKPLEKVTYSRNGWGTTCTLKSFNDKTAESFEIPAEYNGWQVTAIGESAFKDCAELKNLTIPESVTTIADEAFYSSGLTQIVIPETVAFVGKNAFTECRNLTSLTVGGADTSVGRFYNCPALEEITAPSEIMRVLQAVYSPDDRDCLPWNIKKLTLTSGDVPDYPFTASGDNLQIEELVLGKDVAYVGENAFALNNVLESVVIPANVKKIGAGAFGGCAKLFSVIFEDGVEEIGARAFDGCKQLGEITFPDSVVRIGDGAFSHTALKKAEIGKNVTFVGTAFSGCELLEEVVWNASSCGTSGSPFAGSSTDGMTLELGRDVKYVPARLMEGAVNLYEVKFDENSICESIGFNAFAGCQNLIYGIELPSTLKVIEGGAFRASGLVAVTIPKNVTTVGLNALDCPKLVEICNNSALAMSDFAQNVYPGNTPHLSKVYSFGGFVFFCDESQSAVNPNWYLMGAVGKPHESGKLVLPSEVKTAEGIRSDNYRIYAGAFSGRQESSFIIGDCVTSVGKNAFCDYFISNENMRDGTESGTGLPLSIEFKGTSSKWRGIAADGWASCSYGGFEIVCTDATLKIKLQDGVVKYV